jgi:hypothetical protein
MDIYIYIEPNINIQIMATWGLPKQLLIMATQGPPYLPFLMAT